LAETAQEQNAAVAFYPTPNERATDLCAPAKQNRLIAVANSGYYQLEAFTAPPIH
jgi:hypothetical protein